MGTMNFSIPDDVKQAFDEAFGDENKSAIVADLMRKAVAERNCQEAEKAALAQLIAKVLRQRDEDEPVAPEDVRRSREEGRR